MISYFYLEYSPVFIFFVFAFILSTVILVASFIFSSQKGDSTKLSPLECGFDPFEDARNQFDVRFLLIGILFIIFDLEASFLFPWCISLGDLLAEQGSLSFFLMIDFMVELGVGYILAWNVGSFEWLLILDESFFEC